jgi:hypothetical protein
MKAVVHAGQGNDTPQAGSLVRHSNAHTLCLELLCYSK